MFSRKISKEDIVHVIRTGEIIIHYADDFPFPSNLILGFVGKRPVHVVVALAGPANRCIVITAYEPDERIWEKDFKRRRR